MSAEEGLPKLTKWLDYNLLTLNLTKTKYVTFSIKHNIQPPSDLSLKRILITALVLTVVVALKYLILTVLNTWEQKMIKILIVKSILYLK